MSSLWQLTYPGDDYSTCTFLVDLIEYRAMWLALCKCIQSLDSDATSNKGRANPRQSDILGLLCSIFIEINERMKLCKDSFSFYDEIVLVVVERILEKKVRRYCAKPFLLGIPVIPANCIYFISFLAVRSAPEHAGVEKGYLKEMLSLLCDISIGAQSTQSKEHALKALLWFCVADEFDVRMKAIAYLNKYS